MNRYGLEQHGIMQPGNAHWNLVPARLVEEIVRRGEGVLTSTGAVNALTGKRTGRSPKDKFIVDELTSREKIWWGKVNQPIDEGDYLHLRQAVLSYLQGRELFVMDGFAGADSRYTVPIRVVTELAWHSLFAKQLFRRATSEQLATHIPEWTVINACKFQADPKKHRLNSEGFVIVDFARKTVLIGGTQYAGEIKKSIFTVLNYLLPQKGVLPMHCSANIGKFGDVALFFGLSGTGKTTLSADPNRRLIGDDEHGWSDQGVFNFEGGCYAKCIKLDREREPQIWDAIRFGTVIENVVIDPDTRVPNFDDASLTENTRCAYPLDYIANAEPSGMGGHPKAVIFLTCDAFGVFPAVARLTPEQAMYHFMSGYTAKVAGTEAGASKDPSPTFSTCFGSPFLPLQPQVYAELLAKKMKQHGVPCYLVNTGWIGNTFGVSPRAPLPVTRAVISHILDNTIEKATFRRGPVFGLEAPTKLPGVPAELLNPRLTAKDLPEYERRARDLAKKFVSNFEQFKDVSPEILAAAPRTT
jgi:phosphoenolpyruvate carboxykinase (ATP)